jgi:hypothetical protein
MTHQTSFRACGDLIFEFVSDFDIRISDLIGSTSYAICYLLCSFAICFLLFDFPLSPDNRQLTPANWPLAPAVCPLPGVLIVDTIAPSHYIAPSLSSLSDFVGDRHANR